jgi:bifunctional N-acetylglucosamine-1-phosphate-uridyltransferase/glucosamine-1-phosphate-acetyltransferase GlmU-like protein
VSLKKQVAADVELIEFREHKCFEEREALRLEREVVKVESEALKKKGDDMKKEMDGLKEEKMKLEYMIYDLLKVAEAKKEKFKKIRAMCDDE